MFAVNASHASGGGHASVTALNAIGIDMPNAAPSQSCGTYVCRFRNGYTIASASAASER